MGKQFAATKTPTTPQAMADAIWRVWPGELGGRPSLANVCILLGQWALETADGTSMVAFNVGNAKCADPTDQDYCYFTTWEEGIPAATARAMVANDSRCTPYGTWIDDATVLSVEFHPDHPTCRFRAFATLDDGAQNYLRGMWQRWTDAWPYVCREDPEGFAAALKEQGYYTGPESAYATNVRHYFDQFMKTIVLPVDPTADTDPSPP